MGKRNYDPGLGTFTTPDPKTPEVTDSYSYNTYLYTNDAPLGRIDPTGESWWNPLDWGRAVYRGLKKVGQKVGDFLSDCYHAAVDLIQGKSIEEIRADLKERREAREEQRKREAEERKKRQKEDRKRLREENSKHFKNSTKGQNKEKGFWGRLWDDIMDLKDAGISLIKKIGHEVKKGMDKLCEVADKALDTVGGAITRGIKKIKDGVVETAKKVGRAIEAGARAVGRGIAAGARAVSRGIAGAKSYLSTKSIRPLGFIDPITGIGLFVLVMGSFYLLHVVVEYCFSRMYSPVDTEKIRKTGEHIVEDNAFFYMTDISQAPESYNKNVRTPGMNAYNEYKILTEGTNIHGRKIG